MKLWRISGLASGYSLVELVILVAVIAIIASVTFPLYLSYTRAQETDGAARTMVVTLNQARQTAITRGTSHTIESQTNPNNRTRYCSGTTSPCPSGNVVTGPGTDGSGWHRLENGSRIVAAPAITFSSLGAATASGTLRVQNSSQTGCLDVVVSPSGRIRITAPASCP
jgi:Tfp pilus assembly protein FimT